LKKYRHKTNNILAELVEKNKSGVVLHLESGEQKAVALSTFYRWWKEVEDNQVTRIDKPVDKPFDKPKYTGNKVPITDDVVDNLQGTTKQLIATLVKLSQPYQTDTFIRTTTGSYNFTKDGTIYLFVRVNKKGGTIYTKSKALEDKVEYNTTSGSLDAKINIADWNSNIYKQVKEIHDLAINYQITKNIKN
jgi:hypothetical protein